MPRIAAALGIVATMAACIGFNAMRYPAVWEMLAVAGAVPSAGAPADGQGGQDDPEPLPADSIAPVAASIAGSWDGEAGVSVEETVTGATQAQAPERGTGDDPAAWAEAAGAGPPGGNRPGSEVTDLLGPGAAGGSLVPVEAAPGAGLSADQPPDRPSEPAVQPEPWDARPSIHRLPSVEDTVAWPTGPISSQPLGESIPLYPATSPQP